jgi:hypothetical protein
MPNPVLTARSHLGNAIKRKASQQEQDAARAALKAAKLEAAVQRAVSDAPPLTDAQAQRIVAILLSSGGA